MTFSIAARCAASGRFGIAVSSSSPAVAARCAFARAGVGAVASQNITDPSLGERCLDLMALGASAQQALDTLVDSSAHVDYRQLTAVDRQGRCAYYSGARTLGTFAAAAADNVVCAGNLLANDRVPQTMVDAFLQSDGALPLADRLLAAMAAAVDAGGEAGPVRSAGLLVVDAVSWPVADLRVDWSEQSTPVADLDKLWRLYAPQLDDYVTRALDPSAAPSYGVAGDR